MIHSKTAAIIAGLPSRGVSQEYVDALGVCPAGFLSGLLAQLLSMLFMCLPIAKTPKGLLGICQKPNLAIRLGLSSQIRKAIAENYGDDSDGNDAMNNLFIPLKLETLLQMSKLTELDCTVLLSEVTT